MKHLGREADHDAWSHVDKLGGEPLFIGSLPPPTDTGPVPDFPGQNLLLLLYTRPSRFCLAKTFLGHILSRGYTQPDLMLGDRLVN